MCAMVPDSQISLLSFSRPILLQLQPAPQMYNGYPCGEKTRKPWGLCLHYL